MTEVTYLRWLAILLLPGLLSATTAPAQTNERGWRETLQLDAPLLAAKRLENVRGLIEQESWDAALSALTQVEEEFGSQLVQISTGRYVNIALAARLLRLQLPPAGLEAYRQQVDGWARQQLDLAATLHDETPLHDLVTTALVSSAASEALDRLGVRAWEQGEIETARGLWTQMIPIDPPAGELALLRLPDTDRDLAELHARLVLCSLAEGDQQRAEEEWQAFAEQFPEAQGSLAGQQGRLVEILHSELEARANWPAATNDPSWPTFAGAPSRNPPSRKTSSLGSALWTLPLPPVYVPRWERPRPALPEHGVLARYPILHSQGVFFHDGTTIHGIRQDDGQPLWPIGGDTSTEDTPGKLFPPFPVIPNSLPWTPIVGVPRYTLSEHDGRLYALLGASVLTLPSGGNQSSTRLVCLDIAEEQGLLQWIQTPSDLFDDEWLITGTPVVHGERVFVPLVRSDPQISVGVACLRAADGTLVWQQTVGQVLREPLGGRVELGHQLLSIADGRVFFATDFGGVAALETATGRIEWIVTYPSSEPDLLDRSDESGYGLTPPLICDGTVFVKPNDSADLLAIDAASGFVFWRRPAPGGIVHLLSAAGSTLIISGEQLWGIDIETGVPRWRFGYDDVAGFGYGRGAVAGRHIFWPTRDELFVVDRTNGQLQQRVRLQEGLGLGGGNICLDDDHLLICGPQHLTAFALQE